MLTTIGFRYGGFACTVLLLFSGFLITPGDMRPYFGWIRWISPMFYAYENVRSELNNKSSCTL